MTNVHAAEGILYSCYITCFALADAVYVLDLLNVCMMAWLDFVVMQTAMMSTFLLLFLIFFFLTFMFQEYSGVVY